MRTKAPGARGANVCGACCFRRSLPVAELALRSSRYLRFMSAAPGGGRPTHTEQLKICMPRPSIAQ